MRAQHLAPKGAGTSMNAVHNTPAAPAKGRCDFALCKSANIKAEREMGVKMMAQRGEVIDPRPK